MPVLRKNSFWQLLTHFLFPFLEWMKTYSRAKFKIDISAGLTVALVLIPQSMANAQLAGLPAYHGIYAALLPTLVGGLWGSSRQMVTGTVAVTSLMASAALEPFGIASPADYIAHMSLLTLAVGGIQLLLGLARMGKLVNFLSLPVIAGFINASAVIIASSQLGKLFGITVDSAPHQYQTVLRTLSSLTNYFNAQSFVLALLAMVIFFLCRRYVPKLPAVLTAVVLTTFITWSMQLNQDIVAPISTIHSDEARILLLRLLHQEKEITALQAEIMELERQQANSAVEQLEVNNEAAKKRLVQEYLKQTSALAREHLRQMLFVAIKKEDGSRVFYARHSPGLVPGSRAYSVTKQQSETGLDREAFSIYQPTVPAEAFSEGKTWRLRIGGKAPNADAISLSSGVAVVGNIPASLPYFSMPALSIEHFFMLLPSALIIAFIGFTESISIGKNAANLLGYRINPNQELVGQGFANLAGGLTLTSPVSGSFSSSAVNLASGAQTGVACVCASFCALITLLFFTGALQYVPQPVLAVVVIRAVGGLIKLESFKRLWTAQWSDGCIAFVTFSATLYYAPHLDYGIGIGVVLSLMVFFYRAMHPRITALSCGPDNLLRDAKLYGLEECRHIALVQFQGTLFFANAGLLEDHILWRLETQKELRHIHLICSGITQIDASGEDTIRNLVMRAKKQGVEFSFSHVVGPVSDVLERTGILKQIGWGNIFLTPRHAVCAIQQRIQHDANCLSCPLTDISCSVSDGGKCYDPFQQ